MDGWGAALLAIPGQLIAGGACMYCKEWIGYVLDYEKNMKEVQELRSQLENKRNDIKARAEEEIRRENRVMADEVSALLDEATKLLETEVDWEDMLKDSKERKKAEQCCPSGFCSWNPKYRHHLSCIAKEKAAQIDEIKKRMTERATTQLTIARTPPPFETDPANFCPDLKSRVEMLNLIIQKVRDDGVKIIAIHGMGGAGKTTLVEEVAKIADEKNWFSRVVLVEISKDPDVKKIQDEIAEQIDFNGLAGIISERERAKRLREVLVPKDNDNKKLLVVLDNIWDLQPTQHALGIPDGCKIVLTSREKRVCLGMGAEDDNIIHVHDLDDQEARDLLMMRVGPSIIHKENYEPILRELLENCPHLPLSICVLGDVLRSNQDFTFWRDAVRQLKSLVPAQADEVLLGKTYLVLKLSYDSIGKKDKRCFLLLCGLFEPGTDISTYDLFRYGIGLGLFENESSLDLAFERVYKWANELRCSSLLTEVDSERHTVKIHDDVRAAVMIFAIQEDHLFHVGPIFPSLKTDAYEKHTAISVWSYEGIYSLLCRKLDKLQLFSFVDRPPRSRSKFGDHFFLSKKNIKVLKLSGIEEMETLPSSIEHLENLRTLLLEKCIALVDISYICKLVKLTVLSLRESYRISKLPDDFGALGELKYLDMTECWGLEDITAGTMMKLQQLEILYMSYSFCGWENGGSMARLSELQCLPNLRALKIDIENLKQLPDGTHFPARNLSRFDISISRGESKGWDLSKSQRHLMLRDASADDVIKKGLRSLLRCTESLELEDVSNLENIIPYLCENDGLVNLRGIDISGCQALRYLINPRGLSHGRSRHFHNLQELSLYRLESLQPYALPIENASRLRFLKVWDCEALEYIFWTPTNLETPEIQEGIQSSKEIEFTTLKELYVTNLPKFRGFCSERNNTNETYRSLFTEKMKFPALKTVEIDGLGQIMEVWDVRGKELSGAFPKLHRVTLKNCHNVRYLWIEKLQSEHFSFGLKELQYLLIERCDSMEQVILIEDETASGFNLRDKISFSNLSQLHLYHLKSLRCFMRVNSNFLPQINKVEKTNKVFFNEKVFFPSLKTLHIRNNSVLTELWDLSFEEFSIRFPIMETVELHKMSRLKHLWTNKRLCEETLVFGNLKQLSITNCKSFKSLFPPVAPSLVSIETASFPMLTTLTLANLSSFQCLIQVRQSLELSNLDWLSIKGLPKLKTIVAMKSGGKTMGQELRQDDVIPTLFDAKVGFPNLHTLEIHEMSELERICDCEDEVDGPPNCSLFSDSTWFPSLRSLDLVGLPKLKYLSASTYSKLEDLNITNSFLGKESLITPRSILRGRSLQLLHKLIISDCKDMKVIIAKENSQEDEQQTEIVFPNLHTLEIHEMSELERICECEDEDDAPPNCSIFSSSTTKNSTWLPSLKSLVLVGLPKLKHLSVSIYSKLEYLHITNSFHGKESLITPRSILRGRSLQLLRSLWISDCKDMKVIITKEKLEEDQQQNEIVFPQLEYIGLKEMPLLHSFNAAGYPTYAPVLKVSYINGKLDGGYPNLNLNLLLELLQATTTSQPGIH